MRLPRTTHLVALALVGTFGLTQAAAQSVVITNARILDGRGGVIERGGVLVRDGRIVSVSGAAVAIPQGARVIDAKGMTVMPGFIESHRHPIGAGADWLKTEAAARMQEYLDAGFTTMLSAGDDINTAMALRDQIAKGAIKGPRLIVLGRVPTAGQAGGGRGGAAPAAGGRGAGAGAPAGGGGAGRGGAPRIDPARSDRSRAPRTEAAADIPPEQTVAAVAAMAKAGVDGLKTNIVVTPGGPETKILTLIVQEAKKFKLPVITHAVSVVDTLGAVEAGVTSLAHTPHIGQLTPEQTQTIAKAGIPMMSTLGVFVPNFDANNTPLFGDRKPFPFETLSRAGQGPVSGRRLWAPGSAYG